MSVEKLSVSLEHTVVERARRAAAAEGISLSAWLSRAAERAVEEAAETAAARAALDEYLATYGEPDEGETAETRGELEAAGLGKPQTPSEAAARHAALAKLRGEDERGRHSYRKVG